MIETYFQQVEKVLRDFPIIRSYTLTRKVYNFQQGSIGGKIVFENGHSLEFMEVVDMEMAGKVKYRYQYMDENQGLIFRYDNAPHHSEVETFPHHKHISDQVVKAQEPALQAILTEILRGIDKRQKQP